MKTKRTAKDLKIGDTFRRSGCKFTVAKVEEEKYMNGKESLIVSFYIDNADIVDSFFHFKPNTIV